MAYLYFSDGSPDAEEYESNYLYFNESNAAIVSEIEQLLARKKDDPSVIDQIEVLCRKSFETNSKRTTVLSALRRSTGSYVKKMFNRLNTKRLPNYRIKTALSH
jgi:hypothetical protein